MDFKGTVEAIALAFEVVGIAIITIGGVAGIVRAALTTAPGRSFYDAARDGFARPLLLGLEVLVAADIIETITIDRSLESTASLGLLVLIRVILSFSLEAETDGVLPWRKAQLAAQGAPSGQARSDPEPPKEAASG